jgi:hypothetical protein
MSCTLANVSIQGPSSKEVNTAGYWSLVNLQHGQQSCALQVFLVTAQRSPVQLSTAHYTRHPTAGQAGPPISVLYKGPGSDSSHKPEDRSGHFFRCTWPAQEHQAQEQASRSHIRSAAPQLCFGTAPTLALQPACCMLHSTMPLDNLQSLPSCVPHTVLPHDLSNTPRISPAHTMHCTRYGRQCCSLP